MQGDGSGKYRKLGLVRGDQYGKPRRFSKKADMSFTTAEFTLDREMHDAFAAMEAEDGTVPSIGVEDIRRHRQHPWRVIARRFREAHAAGVSKAQMYEVVHVLQVYIARLGTERTKKQA